MLKKTYVFIVCGVDYYFIPVARRTRRNMEILDKYALGPRFINTSGPNQNRN
jgi:hypothetical protein